MNDVVKWTIVVSLLFTSGCAEVHDYSDRGYSDTIQSKLTEFENVPCSICNNGNLVPSGVGDGLLSLSSTIMYCDPSISSVFVPQCAVAGCKHNTNTCSAYVDNALLFAAYEGLWFYVRHDNKADVDEFVCHNPLTNNRKVLYKSIYSESDDEILYSYISWFKMTNHYAFLNLTTARLNKKTYEESRSESIVKITINDQDESEVVLATEDANFLLLGGNENGYALEMVTTDMDEAGDLYVYRELRVYDSGFHEYQTIADTEHGYLGKPDDFGHISDNNLVYGLNDEIHVMNMNTREDKIVLIVPQNLIRCRIDGDKVHYLYCDDQFLYSEVYSFAENKSKLIEKIVSGGVITAAINLATEHGYVTFGNQYGFKWIGQNDYENARFEKGVSFISEK